MVNNKEMKWILTENQPQNGTHNPITPLELVLDNIRTNMVLGGLFWDSAMDRTSAT